MAEKIDPLPKSWAKSWAGFDTQSHDLVALGEKVNELVERVNELSLLVEEFLDG